MKKIICVILAKIAKKNLDIVARIAPSLQDDFYFGSILYSAWSASNEVIKELKNENSSI